MKNESAKTIQTVDPEITREKFRKEFELFKVNNKLYRELGILLLEEAFPEIKLAFCSLRILPNPIVFAVCINFANYDLDPPSVRFIDPFSHDPILIKKLPHMFPRKIGAIGSQVSLQPLVIAQADNKPFFCIPGVREYHHHPAHTGDSWLLHRGIAGEGTLGFIIDKLHQYGVTAINGIQAPVISQSTFTFDIQSISQ
jgi:Predicted metal binding domain